ncbi:MAG: hypothetical protein OXF79_16705 [Chloroflexi bacterium]|nr:hypothetical protein [Chloroflexota bacterium]
MTAHLEHLHPTVTANLLDAAQKVIQRTKQDTPYPFLLDAKLGDANTGPLTDAQLAAAHDTSLSTLNRRVAYATKTLVRTDQASDNPLAKVAQRVNDFMARAAVINRHKRRPPPYSESTIKTFIELGYAKPEHAPIIRAAGHVAPPPIVSTDHDIDFVIFDIAAHLSRSYEPQCTQQILDALSHRQDVLAKWPQLDLTLFIRRVAGINPNSEGRLDPDQPWGTFMRRQQLVANTMTRILSRDNEPHSTQYLTDEINRLVGHLLPNGYNILNAIRNVTVTSNEISWQGLATFGLTQWETNIAAQDTGRRHSTGDLVYAFLLNAGPAGIDDVIQHVQRTTKAKKRTVANAINHDPENRFIRMDDRRIAANPIPDHHNPGGPALTVIPDGRRQGPVLRESELAWLTRYLQGLSELAPPLPCRVALTGPRAAGFAHEGDTLEITVVAEPRDRPDLEPRLAECANAATEAVPSVKPKVRILPAEQWAQRQGEESPTAHHNVWFPPDTASRRDDA